MSTRKMLQNLYLFKGLSEDQMQAIDAIANLETFVPGDDIFSQGDKATALYMIQFGSVRILQKTSGGDNIEVAALGTGSHFGEMAFLDGEPRSATATPIEKSDIVVLDYAKLEAVLAEDYAIAVHFYKQLAHFLAGRLRITTNDLSFSRSQNLSHF